MSSLQFTERNLLEKILGMKSGYVSDFSDRTIKEFVLEKTGIDIFTKPYEINGTSKANRIRTFWQKEPDEITAHLIEALLDYARNEKTGFDRDLTIQEERLFAEARKITQRLRDESESGNREVSIKERFARFKNQILGGTVLRDGSLFAEILGDMDHEFWRNIHETEPYLQSSSDIRLDNLTKGKIILERLEKEPSPRRFSELLLAVYNALALFSATPKNLGDNMWSTYVHRLQAEREATRLIEVQINWLKQPELSYTREEPVEKYYMPGDLEIKYSGSDWGTEESHKILQRGFDSKIIRDLLQERKPGKKVHTINFNGDFVAGDKVGREKNTSPEPGSLSKYWWGLLIPLAVVVLGYMITDGKVPELLNFEPPQSTQSVEEPEFATTTLSVVDILDKNFSFATSVERDAFRSKYKDKMVYGNGTFKDLSESYGTYYLYLKVGPYPVACSLNALSEELENKLLLLKAGDTLLFSGQFTGSGLQDTSWFIRDCNLF